MLETKEKEGGKNREGTKTKKRITQMIVGIYMRNASAKEIWRRAKEAYKVWDRSVENKAAAEPLD